MSKDWQTYLALQNTQTSNYGEDVEYVGMSDEDELDRSGYVDPATYGEPLFDGAASADDPTALIDAQELGLFDG